MNIFQQTFRIGEFAKFARVTIKMLRHYDRLGLLKPIAVDHETNYRYYSAEQLPRLNRIIALKDLGFSLEHIAQILNKELSNEDIRGMLKLRRLEIEATIAQEEERLGRLDAHLQQLTTEEQHQTYDIVIRDIPAQLVATIRATISAQNNDIGDLFDELESYVAAQRGRANLAPLTISYHRDEKEMDVEVIVPLSQPIMPNDRVQVYTLPAVTHMACVVHTGPYHTLKHAYQAFYNWLSASEYQTSGLCRIAYLRFNASEQNYQLPPSYITANNHRYVTELQFPVHKT